MRVRLVLALALAIAGATATAQSDAGFELSVDSIMRGYDLVGYPPSDLRWSGDSRELFYERRTPGEDEAATWVVDVVAGSDPRRLSDDERRMAPAPDSVWDRDRRHALYVEEGDIVWLDTVARVRRQVTRTVARESNPRFTPDGRGVTFVRDGQLFLATLDGAGDVVTQVFAAGPPKTDPERTEAQKFLIEEERRLIRWVDDAIKRREHDEKEDEAQEIPRFEVKKGQRVDDAALSADGRYVFVVVGETEEGGERADVPRYVSETAYAEMIETRLKVGDLQPRSRLAVLDLQERKTTWIDAPFAAREDGGQAGDGEDAEPERVVDWSMPEFSPDGRHAVAMARSADNEDRWFVTVDPATGATRVLEHRHDAAWIRFLFWRMRQPTRGILSDNRFWFLSEADGWLHLYTVDLDDEGSRPVRLTGGAFELLAAVPDEAAGRFYIESNEASHAERQLYWMPITGGPRTRVTTEPGAHVSEVSPDGSTVAAIHSYANRPPEVFLLKNEPGAAARQMTTGSTPEWRSYPWVDPEIVYFEARDGVRVPARLYRPEDVGAQRDPRRPGVVFVHGAGYLQNAHKQWSGYFREYMFHHLLASRGYVVLDVDYRASAGYGRDWRTAIYRHMGGKDLDDVVDGAAYLVSDHDVDPERVGVYGGSYGGFITLMAMFTSPDTFAAGASLRPVTDWAHYNHGYTSNILNEPQSDPEAYRRSSPIYFAEHLKGALLICHGMVDTNVHFQDSVRLAQRLIELRKENWELAVYPVENHGFVEPTSWADEYRRILGLFERHLRSD